MAFGTVKWFSPEIGFGFIRPHNGSLDILVHESACEGLRSVLIKGQQISYELLISSEGRRAVTNVQAVRA